MYSIGSFRFGVRDQSTDLSFDSLIDFDHASLDFEPQLAWVPLNNSEVSVQPLRRRWSWLRDLWRPQGHGQLLPHACRHAPRWRTRPPPGRKPSLAKRIHSTTKLILKNRRNSNYERELQRATLLEMDVAEEPLAELATSDLRGLYLDHVSMPADLGDLGILDLDAKTGLHRSCGNVEKGCRDHLKCQRRLQVFRYYKYFA